MLLSGTVRFSARCSGSGRSYPPGKIVIGSSAPDARIVNLDGVRGDRQATREQGEGRQTTADVHVQQGPVAILRNLGNPNRYLSSPVVPGPGEW